MTTFQNNPLTGTWKLASFAVHRKNGATHFPFGKNPVGQFIFTDNGRFSTQIVQTGRIAVSSGDIMDASHEEMASNFRGYIAYFGKYSFDETNKEVILNISGSLFPNWEGDALKRKVKLIGDQLELSTEPTKYGGEKVIGVITWKKID